MKTITEKTDSELKTDVLAELKYEPGVNTSDIGVLAKDGAVTLNGFVTNYGEKWNAVRATKRVAGVRAVADDIVVKLHSSIIRPDGEIASAAANQISWFSPTPKGAVQVMVRDGWLTLEGEVELGYQRGDVEDNVQFLAGVKGVTNLITVKSKLSAVNVKDEIETAFERSALLDADKIEVQTAGTTVTLRGQVRNHAERDEAERVAWAAPGVGTVDNKIEVKWSWGAGDYAETTVPQEAS
jgi:osmotically-inducible protein OsmY